MLCKHTEGLGEAREVSGYKGAPYWRAATLAPLPHIDLPLNAPPVYTLPRHGDSHNYHLEFVYDADMDCNVVVMERLPTASDMATIVNE